MPLTARLYERDTVHGMVPLMLVRLLALYLTERHVSVKGMPDLATLDTNPLARFPAEAYCQLLIEAAERLQDPLLGLHLGQTLHPKHLGALGYVLLACENLGAALARIERYHRLVHDINPLQHLIEGEHLALQWGVAQGKPGALFDEVGVSAIVQFARDVCGQRLPLHQIDFVNPPPSDTRPYTEFFACPVRFGQPLTRLVIPLPYLLMPLRQPDATLRQLMETQVDAALAQLPDTGDLSEQTRRVLAHLAPQGLPTLEQVACELRLSPRIFYRRLADQGLNFRELRETTLRQVAEMHLRDPRLTLAEVGALLGYSEQSAFSRAFKRWTGSAPLNWRQGQTPDPMASPRW